MNVDALLRRNRWLSFDDSWSVTDVVAAFEKAHVSPHDVVIDPFIGCGTTALVAASRGITIHGGDLSPLAVFVTQMKCAPMHYWDVQQLQIIFQQYTWSMLAHAIHQRTLHMLVPTDLVIPVVQCFVVATCRSGWQLEDEMPQAHFQSIVQQCITEITDDIASQQTCTNTGVVYCDDFRQCLAYITHRTPTVMITSPPFFGSRASRLRMLFDTVLPPYIQESKKRTLYSEMCATQEVSAEIVARYMVGIESLYQCHQVCEYILFLCDVVELAVKAHCRAMVLEMGPKFVENRWIHFEEIVNDILHQRGFVVASVDEVLHTSEPVFRIHAHTRSDYASA